MNIESFEKFKPHIGKNVYIAKQALIIGNVAVGEDSSIWPFAVARGDVNSISIGYGTSIQDNSVLHVTHDGPYTPGGTKLMIGNKVTVGHSVNLHACTIEDLSLIGIGSTILDNAIIKQHCLIGAGSLVLPNMELEGGYLWAGSPVKKIRKLTNKEIDFFDYSAKNYIKLKNKYLSR